MKNEKDYKPASGYLGLLIGLVLLLSALLIPTVEEDPFLITIFIVLIIIGIFCLSGLRAVNPNESVVLTLFGKYVGTIKINGFCWMNPFFLKKKVSLRARNLDSQPLKVNDKMGNPIMIGVVLVWRVEDTYKAAFEVDNYENFVKIQSEAAIRKMAGTFCYDNLESQDADITLRSGGNEINNFLVGELHERLSIAGINVMEARINYLAYAAEIAGAMLQRQQATAIVAARFKIVEGAVGMVQNALQELSAKGIIDLDDEKKAAMVSNLMVVLCSERAAQPVLNSGSLYQ
ncbi:MAG TPA: SPFH domain-containing protein [Bacteroidales bacterium]|nr:SPFH domain-containing protein [Bacteroidales bacterium]HPS16176.1 SPFH domain-containing protein [Bacteroidales bacterium]